MAEFFDWRSLLRVDAKQGGLESSDLKWINITADVLRVAVGIGALANNADGGALVNHDRIDRDQHMTAGTGGELFAKGHWSAPSFYQPSIISGSFKKLPIACRFQFLRSVIQEQEGNAITECSLSLKQRLLRQ